MTTMWLVELVPAFEEHPPFQTTYYAGYRFDLLNEAKTFDPNRAARFLYKYDAGHCSHEAVAEQVLCVESKGAYVL
jgi:hypothetical protein